MKNNIKKLQLNKEVISNLSSEMQKNIQGGEDKTGNCGVTSINVACNSNPCHYNTQPILITCMACGSNGTLGCSDNA